MLGQRADRIVLVDPEDRVLLPAKAATKAAAKRVVGAWIEAAYNRTRRHSSLGMLSPAAFEHQLTIPGAEAA